MSIQCKIHNLVICLESLELYAIDNINTTNAYNSYISTKYYLNKKTNYSLQEILNILSAINNLLLYTTLQEKIRIILVDYAHFHHIDINMFSITTKQYLNRFIYKYQIFYKYDAIKDIYQRYNKNNQLFHIAITQLYLCNKIIAYEGPYLLYQYLYRKQHNINTKP